MSNAALSFLTSPKFDLPVEGALFLSRLGLKVFPVATKAKKPAYAGWQNLAKSFTTEQIDGHGKIFPAHNWGVYCGASDLVVLDIDNKNGKLGGEYLNELQIKYGTLPKTLTVRTPNNGIHYYFRGLCGSGSKLLKERGIDVQSKGKYVVAPGSTLNNGGYEIIRMAPIAICPSWLLDMGNKKNTVVDSSQSAKVAEGTRNNKLASLAGAMRRHGANNDTILTALTEFNQNQVESPLDAEEVESVAKSISGYDPEMSEQGFSETQPFVAHTLAELNLATIPKRDWVIKHRYMGGFVSVIVASGGSGKSTLATLDALGVSMGKPLTGFDIIKNGAAWFYCAEDPREELDRRFAAATMHHKIDPKEVKSLYYTSGLDSPFCIANETKNGVLINERAKQLIIDFIKKHKVVLFIADPLVKTHDVEENANKKMDKVIQVFSQIANATGCAIGLIHHANKAGAGGKTEPGDMNASRGASSTVDAARIVHTVATMSKSEAKKLGVAEEVRGWYFRLDNAKGNMQPPASSAAWFHKMNVTLPCMEPVGTVERIEFKNPKDSKREEADKVNRSDIGESLYSHVSVNKEKSFKDLSELIFKDRKNKHIFSKSRSLAYKKELLKKQLRNGLSYKNKVFSLEKRGRMFYVSCKAVTPYED